MFAIGNGMKQNYDEAMKFFQLAILGGSERAKSNLLNLGNRNISQAQCLLGELYLEGRGFVKDEKKAVEWIGKAAQQHDDGAIEKLHMMAEQGHVEAQNKLCEMNETRRR
jgi:TPR repeat protein